MTAPKVLPALVLALTLEYFRPRSGGPYSVELKSTSWEHQNFSVTRDFGAYVLACAGLCCRPCCLVKRIGVRLLRPSISLYDAGVLNIINGRPD